MRLGAMPERPMVLIIDDAPEVSELLSFLLDQHGFEVRTAADAQEALWLLRGGLRPGLLLLDLMSPEKSGRGFRQNQLADATLAEIPTVIYSAAAHSREASIELSAADYADKMLHFDDLLMMVQRHCRVAS